jgi:RNA polymerase sigma factor (sigma-70 family)
VLLSDAGECRLSDFGVARLVTEDLGLTRTKAFMGKVPYVSPETFHGIADELSDVYSLGVTLTEAAIGRRLFPASTVHESMAARIQTDVHKFLVKARNDLPPGFAELLARLTSHDRNDRPSTDEALTRFEQMAGSTTSTAEYQLADLVKMVSETERTEPDVPSASLDEDQNRALSEPGTATLVFEHDRSVQGVVRRTVSAAASSAELIEDLLAAGNLALVEAKRDYDPNNPTGASFSTFALPRVQRAVIEALAMFRGVSRGAYRAARRDAAAARAEASRPHEVRTERCIAYRLEAGGPSPNPEPFTNVERSMERDELRAAIERIPFAREREMVRMVGLQGMTQRTAGEKFGIHQATASKALASGFQMLRELLEIGSALDAGRLPATLATLGDSPQGEVIRLLYLDRVDLPEASRSLGVSGPELRARHRVALGAIKKTVLRPSDGA